MPENQEPLQADRAYALASRLTLIPDFPNRDQAIQAVAEWLLDTCPLLVRAEWLIRTANTDRPVGSPWQGVSELQARYDAKYRPGLPIWSEPVKERCPRCWDTGLVNYADSAAIACDCPAGDRRREDPDRLREVLAELNASSVCVTITKSSGVRKLSQFEAEMQEETERIKAEQAANRKAAQALLSAEEGKAV